MGRSKSWLALALAIVMVFAIAVPTAFATTIPGNLFLYTNNDGGKGSGDANCYTIANPLVLSMAELGGVKLFLGEGSTANKWVLDKSETLGNEVYVTVTDNAGSTYVSTTIGDGFITFKPVKMTTQYEVVRQMNISVRAKNNAWKFTNDEIIYSRDVFYKVTPSASYPKGEIILDVTPNNAQNIPSAVIVNASDISAQTGDEIKIIEQAEWVAGSTSGTAPRVDTITTGNGSVVVGRQTTADPQLSVFRGTLRVAVTVNGVPAFADIIVIVGDVVNASTMGYKVGSDVKVMTVKPTDGIISTALNVFPADFAGKPVAGRYLYNKTNAAGIHGPLDPVDPAKYASATVVLDTVLYRDGTTAVNASFPIPVTLSPVTIGADIYTNLFDRVSFSIPNVIVKATGHIIVHAYSAPWDDAQDNELYGLVDLKLPLNIEPLDFVIKPNGSETLAFDLNGNGTKNFTLEKPTDSYYNGLTLQSALDFTPSTNYFDRNGAIGMSVETINGDSTPNKYAIIAAETAVDTKGAIKVRVSYNGYYTPWKTISYTVVDTSPKPTISTIKSTLYMDMNGSTSDSLKLISHPLVGKQGVISNPEYYLVVDGLTVVPKGNGLIRPYWPHNVVTNPYFYDVTAVDENRTLEFTSGQKRIPSGKGTVYIRAQVDGKTTDWIAVPVEINDTAEAHAHHVWASISNINHSVLEAPATFQAQLQNSANVKVRNTSVTYIDYEVLDSNMRPWASTIVEPITLTRVFEAGYGSDTFAITYNRGGSGFLKLYGGSDLGGIFAEATPVLIPFNITALPVNVTPTTLDFDYAGKTTMNIEVTAKTGTYVSLYGIVNTLLDRVTTYPANIPGLKRLQVNQELSVRASNPGNDYVWRFSKLVLTAELGGTTTFPGGLKTGSGTFDITNLVVDSKLADVVTINYSIADTTSIYATPSKFDLSMLAGGNHTGTFKLKPNPSTAVYTYAAPVSMDPAVATVTAMGNDEYLVTATGKGVTTIVVSNCKVNGKAVGNCVVTVSVDPDVVVPAIVLSVAKTGLYLETADNTANTNTTYSWAVTTGTLSNDDISIIANAPTAADGANVIELDKTTKTITAKAEGYADLQVTGTVDGKTYTSNIVRVTVTKYRPVQTAGVYINGVLHQDGGIVYVASNYKYDGFNFTVVDANGNNVKVANVTWKTPKGKKTPLCYRDASASLANVIPKYFGNVTVTVNPVTGGARTLVVNFQALRETSASYTQKVLADNPKALTRGYFFDFVEASPANSWFMQPKYWNFTSKNTGIATIKSSNGIIYFQQGGTVTLVATKKSGSGNKSLVSRYEITLTVDDQYTNTKYYGAVLSNSVKAPAIVSVLGNQVWAKGSASAAGYALSEAGYTQMLAELATKATATDISTIYIEGGLSKSGLTVGSRQIKMTELASDLAKIPGKIFLVLNGSASTFYTAKDAPATPAEIASAFAKVEKAIQDKETGMSFVDNNFWSAQKFYVISATNLKKATASSSKITSIEDAFIANLALNSDGTFVATDKRTVDFTELYYKLSRGLTGVGVYPAGAGLRVADNFLATAH